MQWFDVDRRGLSQLIAARGKAMLVHELVQNAWDAPGTTRVTITLSRPAGSRNVTIRVEDDSPEGFKNLAHAFTLFAPSDKKTDATARGRFNLGEKLVIAMCDEASIETTKGTVVFTDDGRGSSRRKRKAGSVFTGSVKLTADEVAEVMDAARRLIPPPGIATTINGEPLAARAPSATFNASLPTELADAEGVMRATERKCEIRVYDPLPGETPSLYEMGIPVVDTGDRWHVEVMQKVPLNMQRDNVRPSYLARLRALVLEHMYPQLSADDANAVWVHDAFKRHGKNLPAEAVCKVLDLRFGDKRVSFDPSDPEANKRAVAAGYVVVHGSQMSRAEWAVVRHLDAIPAAGRVTPSPQPYSASGDPLKILTEDRWTPTMRQVVAYAEELGRRLLGKPIEVVIVNDITWRFAATYGPASPLTLNLGTLGHRWFEGELEPINRLLIHEFSHDRVSDHLDTKFADEHARLGARMVELALAEPELFALRSTTNDALAFAA